LNRSPADLRSDALAIWHAGLAAVKSDRLVQENVHIDGDWLLVGNDTLARSASEGSPFSITDVLRIPLASIHRIAVVGAGKAGAGMAAGLEKALGPKILAEKNVHGWINVPADCIKIPLPPGEGGERSEPGEDIHSPHQRIHLHSARPAGLNEPTTEGVFGAEKILEIVSSLGPTDLCICLLSGGGSALLPAPVPGVSLAEKQAITRHLSSSGANIEELNTVRKQLSRIKGGGLARACRAGCLITLIISDVLGDPLDVIASGPTVPDTRTPEDALAILRRYGAEEWVPLVRRVPVVREAYHSSPCHIQNLIIGNNARAVDAAGIEAERRGYSHAMHAATSLEGPAEEIGRHLAQLAQRMQSEPGPDCLITGGEPTVKLAPPEIRGLGGRNQQLVLAALIELLNTEPNSNLKSKIQNPKSAFVLLSAGTDGEDGPTDAAGAIIDNDLLTRLRATSLDPADFLRRNDAYTFFNHLGGLIKTGPTHTNVCDLRVVVVDRN
jgi:glycerate 2-kinase